MAIRTLAFGWLLGVAASAPGAERAVPARIEFNRDVRPILSENCFACHGFDPKHREGGLRLDISLFTDASGFMVWIGAPGCGSGDGPGRPAGPAYGRFWPITRP